MTPFAIDVLLPLSKYKPVYSEVRELIVRRLMLLLYPPQSFLLLPLSKYKPVSSEVRELIVRRLIILVHRVQTIL